jgi:hypothetical protein
VVVSMAASKYFSLVATQRGEVWTFGEPLGPGPAGAAEWMMWMAG